MAASYPTSVKSFATRTTGQTIAGSWFNDPQDEIAAVEGGLLNGIAHTLKPSAAGGQDLGSTTVPWANGYFTGLPMDIGLCEGRLTLTSGTAVTTADVTAAGTIYFTPFRGNRVALHDGTNWALYTFTELSLVLTLTSGKPYDIWLYNNAGVLTLESLVWTNDTTRATALATQNGVLVKTGATTRRYLGTIYSSGANTTEDSATKRYVWNYYNRIRRPLLRLEATASWTYTTATWRQANAAAANQVDMVIGVAEALLDLTVSAMNQNTGAAVISGIGLGEDSTSSPLNTLVGGLASTSAAAAAATLLMGRMERYPAVGRHYYAWLEWSTASGTMTWLSAILGSQTPSGITGWIEG